MSSGTDIVTQALALFAERYTPARNTSAAFEGRAVPLGSPAELISTPDVCLQIGRNDLGLPLVAAIRRSRPFDHHLNALASELERSGIIPPAALIDSFKKSLVDLRQQSWSRYCIREVLRTDGISEAMYVSNANLTGLLRPFLPRLLPDPTATMSAVQSPGTGRAITMMGAGSGVRPIPSVGGTNRFLGISVGSGLPYSVGMQEGAWTEWHPFFLEDISRYSSGAQATISANASGATSGPPAPLETVIKAVQPFLFRNAGTEGTLQVTAQAWVSRADLLRVLLRIGRQIVSEHAAHWIHGDIKPANVLLTADKPTLIDSLALTAGDVAGAFTPVWSAPEQALGEPVQSTSNVYPLALMTVAALQGRVFGEVRKYRSSLSVAGQNEFDLFHDPHVFFGDGAAAKGQAAQAYGDLIRRGLVFDPGARLEANAFVEELEALSTKFPVANTIAFSTGCDLMVVKAPGGSDVAAQYVLLE